jgi:membrane protein required for colicin V production
MFNVLDLVIIAVLLLSAIMAAWRGFTREVLSIGSWVGAAIAMFVLGPKAVPLMEPYIEHDMLATIAAFAAVFVLALIPLSYISFRISEGVRDSLVGPVDRLFGLVFGGARGLVIVGIGFLVFTSLVGESRIPDWFKEARLRPLMEGSGKVIASLLPTRPTTDSSKPPAEDPVIGTPGRSKADEPEAEEPAPKPRSSKPKDTAEKTAETTPAKPVPKPTAKPVEKVADARPAAEKTAKKATPPKEPPAEDAEGYGEGQRDALDQLIGSATASP